MPSYLEESDVCYKPALVDTHRDTRDVLGIFLAVIIIAWIGMRSYREKEKKGDHKKEKR